MKFPQLLELENLVRDQGKTDPALAATLAIQFAGQWPGLFHDLAPLAREVYPEGFAGTVIITDTKEDADALFAAWGTERIPYIELARRCLEKAKAVGFCSATVHRWLFSAVYFLPALADVEERSPNWPGPDFKDFFDYLDAYEALPTEAGEMMKTPGMTLVRRGCKLTYKNGAFVGEAAAAEPLKTTDFRRALAWLIYQSDL